MSIKIIRIQDTEKGFIADGEAEFLKRVHRFMPVEIKTILPNKKWNQLPANLLKEKEGEQILQQIKSSDLVILLDEKGKQFTSRDFATFIEQKLTQGKLVFVIGGAFGFSPAVYGRANGKLSLSKMTTSHQLIRLFFTEQLYRAFTILHNHPYHND